MFAAINALVTYHQLRRDGKTFHVELADGMTQHAQSNGVRQR